MQTTPQNIKAKKAPHTLKSNDILYTNWGYEQTNVEFYQVVKTTNYSVWVKELKQNRVESSKHSMGGNTMPLINEFKHDAKEHMHRVRADNSIRIESFITAWLWDGKPKSYSSYA
ncbi:MAG: hypothetical protein V4525_08155 [Pseudomonadota bacterium]